MGTRRTTATGCYKDYLKQLAKAEGIENPTRETITTAARLGPANSGAALQD